jgi:hypothetical protein
MGMELARSVVERHGKRLGGHARLVKIDLDPTDDATHGAQQLSFFNAHYDNWCYLPMMGFVSFDDEPDQYLCAAVLRPGNVTATAGAVGVLRRLIEMVRASFPKAHSRAAKSSPASGNSSALQKKKRKSARQRTKLLVFTKKALWGSCLSTVDSICSGH